MAEVVRTPQFKRDLRGIWRRIAVEGGHPLNADRFIRRIEAEADAIADFPASGRRRDDLAAGLRSFNVGVYIVLYRERRGTIELLRVLHGSRDLPRHF